jgi:hypothetical protein
MIKHIFFKNGKEYLRVSNKNWNNYLNQVSPDRLSNTSDFKCALKDKKYLWCNTCNTELGNLTNSCVNIISSLNLQKHSNILFKDFEKLENEKYYEIEIDRNDNNSTI